MTILFFDTEYTGESTDASLISIGIISENDTTFYAEFNDYQPDQLSPWVERYVIQKLKFSHHRIAQSHYLKTRVENSTNTRHGHYNVEMTGSYEEIRKELLHWLDTFDLVEFWGDRISLHWQLLSRLMANYVERWPIYPENVNDLPFDLTTLFYIKGIDPSLNREYFAFSGNIPTLDFKHNALWDARIVKSCYERLLQIK